MLPTITFWPYSQGAERTKVHVYLPYRGAISFYVYIVALSLISIFLYVGRVQISCRLLPTRFCYNFPIKLLLSKNGEISDSFLAKTTCVIRYNTLLWLLWFSKFLLSYERLKTYFQTSAQEICVNLGLFPILKQQLLKNRLKNQGNRNNVAYVVFYELSDDKSHFLNKRTCKFANLNSIVVL